ncbi:V/A-type H+-transporting ATPase subunit C [Methanolinea mesophila]|nr:V/A-type H+-transporting ATPase subunit C [Methanolinea mesophila]
MLHMDIFEFVRYLGEDRYKAEFSAIPARLPPDDRLEAALDLHLSRSFQDVLDLTSGNLRHFTLHYLKKYDIVNVMMILRGKAQGMDPARIERILIPAGEMEARYLDSLAVLRTPDEVVSALKGWDLYPLLARLYDPEREKGMFAHLENELYKGFYTGLLEVAGSGLPGGDIFRQYVRLEIDILNIRNLFRIHSCEEECDVLSYIIPGGAIPPGHLRVLSFTDDREHFEALFGKLGVFHIIFEALKQSAPESVETRQDALDFIWKRWEHHQVQVPAVALSITRSRLKKIDGLARRHPFSVLPVLTYLERTQAEVANLRAIGRGKKLALAPERIAKYLIV